MDGDFCLRIDDLGGKIFGAIVSFTFVIVDSNRRNRILETELAAEKDKLKRFDEVISKLTKDAKEQSGQDVITLKNNEHLDATDNSLSVKEQSIQETLEIKENSVENGKSLEIKELPDHIITLKDEPLNKNSKPSENNKESS
ncbi:2437_t:CDS:2 [Cetraspora pellucida]|uniref:2437_t:CDS:1 n=1 Tax=Cetraspora pellucida TaxID=1433469 RepID=A0A9N8VVC1_9GLOM|nr:2437_t:CDS:2 [Cetraspora pellucida]